MAGFIIDVNLRNYREHSTLPETVRVRENSIVRWELSRLDDLAFSPRYFGNELLFTLYFEKESPFQWQHESILLPFFPRFYTPSDKLKLAEGVVVGKGEYKYGLMIKDYKSDTPIYDEDPFIVVF